MRAFTNHSLRSTTTVFTTTVSTPSHRPLTGTAPFAAGESAWDRLLIRRVAFAFGAASFALLFAPGCTPTTRYYALSAVGGDAAFAARPATGSAVIALGPVELPDYIDRPQIVTRTGANTLDQAAFDQWGGDLDDMIPRLLVEDLAAKLPADHVVPFPQVADVGFAYRVPVSITQFDVSTSGEAVVAARWQVRGPGGTLAVRETVARSQADGKSFDARVAALSRALADVTADIASVLAPLPRGEAGGSAATHAKSEHAINPAKE